jgi:hypothetical protein
MKRKLTVAGLLAAVAVNFAAAQILDFDKDEAGNAPRGFSTALTGSGRSGMWMVMKDETAPSQPNVLAQTDMDATGYRFPVCVLDAVVTEDADISVKFKPVKGSKDQAAGIVWRYVDGNNYYIVRANALEDNVVLYKVEKGKRTDLPIVGKGRTYGEKEKVPSGEWGTLRIAVQGNRFDVYHNGKKLFEVVDGTFTKAGKVGLWTKADSYTLFDDLTISVPEENK